MHHLTRAQFAAADADAKTLPSLVQRTSLIPAVMRRKVLESLQRQSTGSLLCGAGLDELS